MTLTAYKDGIRYRFVLETDGRLYYYPRHGDTIFDPELFNGEDYSEWDSIRIRFMLTNEGFQNVTVDERLSLH